MFADDRRNRALKLYWPAGVPAKDDCRTDDAPPLRTSLPAEPEPPNGLASTASNADDPGAVQPCGPPSKSPFTT